MSRFPGCRRTRTGRGWAVALAACLAGGAADVAHAEVSARIVRVGLFGGGKPLVRVGEYAFVEVELRYNGTAPFEGRLRVEQADCDGDLSRSITPVALAPTGDPRSYFVYFVPQATGVNDTARVQLLDAEDKPVTVIDESGAAKSSLVSDAFYDLPGDELLIVDLTLPRKLPHVAWLDSERRGPRAIEQTHPRKVRAMSPSELPNRWYGLEPVDAIVWDDADPGALNEQQVEALMGWVRQGGRLLIAAGKNWQALASSPLAAVLPVTITGVSAAGEALEFADLIGEQLFHDLDLERQYMKRPFLRCQLTALPGAIDLPGEVPGDLPRIAYRRMEGRGVVTFVGASLMQLVPPPAALSNLDRDDAPTPAQLTGNPFLDFSERIIGRGFLSLPAQRERQQGSIFLGEGRDLFRLVRRTIQFSSHGAAFLFFAILYAGAYWILAAVGSFYYLRRRGLLHHCWSAFALISVVASVVGTGMVWSLRGVTRKVWQTTVLDARAGSDHAYGLCLAGLKTPDHTRVDVSLPCVDPRGVAFGGGPLRVIPRMETGLGEAWGFAAPESYVNAMLGTRLEEVPHRATLKEYYGLWEGPIGGTVEGKLIIRRSSQEPGGLEFADGSFIRNNLGVDLKECCLLETGDDLEVKTVFCHYLKDLPHSGPGAEITAAQLRARLNYLPPEPNAAADAPPSRRPPVEILVNRSLGRWYREISGALVATGETNAQATAPLEASDDQCALLLLSLFDLIQPGDGQDIDRLRRSLGRRLGCTHQLTRNTAILIGYSEAPSAAKLEIDGDKTRPTKAHTMYRILLPVER